MDSEQYKDQLASRIWDLTDVEARTALLMLMEATLPPQRTMPEVIDTVTRTVRAIVRPHGKPGRPGTGRRIGRWAYNSDSTLYGVAGWHLDNSPVVIAFRPFRLGMTDCRPSRGLYLGYNWPGRPDGWLVAKCRRDAMRIVEREWDESPFAVAAAALAGES